MGYRDDPIVKVRQALKEADDQKKLASRARRLRMLVEHKDYPVQVERIEVKMSIFRREVSKPIESEILSDEDCDLLAKWLQEREDAAIAKATELEQSVVGAMSTDV